MEDTQPVKVKAIRAEAIRYNRTILMAALEMLRVRSEEYAVGGLIESLREANTVDIFQAAILSPAFANPVRDTLALFYKKGSTPSLRIMMSLPVKNSTEFDTYTVIFFAQQKETMVSKRLIELFFQTLSALKTLNLYVSEVIIITPAPLSASSENDRRELSATCFTQIFNDHDILTPPTRSLYAPSYQIMTLEESREFFAREINLTPGRMQQISSANDPHLKYLGCRPQRVVRVMRVSVIPNGIRQGELTFAWAY